MSVFVSDEQDIPVDLSALRSIAMATLDAEGCPPDTEVAVMFIGDEEMAAYNERYMGKASATDVLSFPLEQLTPGRPPSHVDGGPPLTLGDVLIAPAYVQRQAGELSRSFHDEVAMFLVHGLLHLLGYDHESENDAERMEEREREILTHHGLVRR